MATLGRQLLPVLLGSLALHCAGVDSTALQSEARSTDATEIQRGSGEAPPPTTAGACQPRAVGGPFWIAEGESAGIELTCDTGAELPSVELPNAPPNVTYDASTRLLHFMPGLDQAGVYELELALVGSEERGHLEVQVADAFDAPGNVPVDPFTYTREYGLPVLHLGVDAGINRDDYTPATIVYRGKEYAGAQAKYRGASSHNYPKKSFTLKFAKTDRFDDPLSIAGFTGKRRVTLTTTFDDNSMLRPRLAFELWNRASVEHIQVQTYSVVVYLDGAFHGLYTLTDHIDGNLAEDHGHYEDGNLYKARTHDANFRLTRATSRAEPKARLSEGYTKEEGFPLAGEPGANDDLEALVRWVATADDATFLSQLGTRLVQSDYEDWWILVSLIYAADSAGKNSYHYRDPRPGAPDGRFRVVPWDFNDSFGQTWKSQRRRATIDPEGLNGQNRLFERLLAGTQSRAGVLARYRSLLDGPWALDGVLATLDTWAAEIRPVAARDERKWGAAYRKYYRVRSDFTTHDGEVAYIREWIAQRWEHVRSRFWPPSSSN